MYHLSSFKFLISLRGAKESIRNLKKQQLFPDAEISTSAFARVYNGRGTTEVQKFNKRLQNKYK
jgi:hypothetical protein